MRVLMVSNYYPPFIGGTERQVQLLSRELILRGHEVSVATIWHSGLPEYEDDAGVQVHRLKGLTTSVPWFSKDPTRRIHPPFPEPGLTWRLRELIKKWRPDVVHATGWIAYSSAAALLGSQIPLVVSARDYGYGCALHTLLRHNAVCDGSAVAKCLECTKRSYGVPKALAAVLGVFGCRTLLQKKMSACHTASTFVQSTVWRDVWGGRECAQQAKNGSFLDVVIPSFREDGDDGLPSESFLERLPAEPYILFVGAFRAYKGLEVLLAAYKQLVAPPPIVLIGGVFGTTSIESAVEFPPGAIVFENVPHPCVMAAWERCLFGVAPSLWPEPFGGVIHEAMSKGKAVIATNLGGPVDMVVPGKTGLLVPPGDINTLATAMQELIGNANLREQLGQAGRERAQLYTANAVVPRFEELYRQVIAQNHGMPQ